MEEFLPAFSGFFRTKRFDAQNISNGMGRASGKASGGYRAGAADKKEAEIASLNRQVEWLSQQLRLTRGQKFGTSSGQAQMLSEQFSLFNEAEVLAECCISADRP